MEDNFDDEGKEGGQNHPNLLEVLKLKTWLV